MLLREEENGIADDTLYAVVCGALQYVCHAMRKCGTELQIENDAAHLQDEDGMEDRSGTLLLSNRCWHLEGSEESAERRKCVPGMPQACLLFIT